MNIDNLSESAILVSFIISILLIPVIIMFSKKFSFFDRVNERKVHTGNIPRLGGIGIFISFVVGINLLHNYKTLASIGQNMVLLCIAGASICFMGVWDDFKSLKARYKLLIQCLAAVLVLAGNFTFNRITFGTIDLNIPLGLLKYPITFCWIIGIINAFNLIDGIDGLAGGISLLCAVTFSVFFFKYSNYTAMNICLILSAAIFGFLLFNLPIPRARIFMGDGGSQFLGFILAVLPLLSSPEGDATIALPYAAAVLIIPICDTISAIWRRKREGRRIDSPDKFHIHHKLMLMGFSKRSSLLIILTLQGIISIFICCAMWLQGFFAFLLLMCTYVLAVLFFTLLHVQKKEILKNLDDEKK